MLPSRARLSLLAVIALLGGGIAGCGTDDAIERDARDAGQEIEKAVDDVDGK